MTTTKAVELRSVTKTYGSVRAVDGLSLSIEPGEVVAFLGPNGAGKTTTIDMMLGLATPTTGTVSVFGGTPADAIAQGRISAVMQTGGLLRDLTVRETVELTSALFAHTRSVKEVLTRAGIADIGDRRVAKCSGGQQQRLRFALALLPDPDLLVLDEPTTGMDVEGRRDFWNAIRQDASTGRTVLFATHYLDEADAYADRIVLVRHGKIVADGSAAEVKNLAAGRTVTATLPGVDQSVLLALPGVDRVDTRGDRVIVHGRDSDAVARYLLNDAHATDLEIVSRNLEDAFLALTTDSENDRAENDTAANDLAGSIR
ncbi:MULTISPECIES: ABC transporter ATP-binding protein [unclassified Rhodococcus (in: high G+C Gram-positive bacteria)]|uniref:ABC transporter ATP-binding protein n=1 Tax=unclassified Rhodococcus (in: high G+C Gram-positive bacteria) TaxID=192944 RepID=UPI000B9BE343|nr:MULTISPECIES: ABC transporter ATP-binding protein [unclassified Rhodococcus (in: high G+C Gram-positive bacteria)]OZE26534.1 multidrug ABC transporter ATP-binding protein [Rhodococcus sp. 05-2254-6]OZE35474.1 multidrug ABC transporter ATP-binding protein [Rhodococcus sp. 05-2254-4]OZE47903.1 multidrug ABC transporter ATP-binding protein [Rhodococcus sp. 05-2254-3]OZE49114.1 multidrug ABC transporter ATP-binding protein [Rhodococcus sp. 05-2254-2]